MKRYLFALFGLAVVAGYIFMSGCSQNNNPVSPPESVVLKAQADPQSTTLTWFGSSGLNWATVTYNEASGITKVAYSSRNVYIVAQTESVACTYYPAPPAGVVPKELTCSSQPGSKLYVGLYSGHIVYTVEVRPTGAMFCHYIDSRYKYYGGWSPHKITTYPLPFPTPTITPTATPILTPTNTPTPENTPVVGPTVFQLDFEDAIESAFWDCAPYSSMGALFADVIDTTPGAAHSGNGCLKVPATLPTGNFMERRNISPLSYPDLSSATTVEIWVKLSGNLADFGSSQPYFNVKFWMVTNNGAILQHRFTRTLPIYQANVGNWTCLTVDLYNDIDPAYAPITPAALSHPSNLYVDVDVLNADVQNSVTVYIDDIKFCQ